MRYILYIFILIVGSSCYAQTMKRTQYFQNDSIYIGLINPFLAPIEINSKPLDSVASFAKVNRYGLLKKGDTLKNALVLPLDKLLDTIKIDMKKYMSFKATFGNPNTTYNKDYKYELPYPKGKKYTIIQTFGGKFSHSKSHSKYAIDFGLAIGDTITAARAGHVFFVKEDSKTHCRTRKCVDMANKIYVLHDDGTMAHYVHLDFDGALVEVGDWVDEMQPIGISGMTGFTTIPHLHFVLYKSGSISIPYTFKGINKKKLKQGKAYLNSD